ncbi:MAG: signal peptidase I [Bdellovibrionota bacterium]
MDKNGSEDAQEISKRKEAKIERSALVEKSNPGFFSYENLKSLFIIILAILALRWSVASPYHVPTASMEPTIKVGDRLLAFKLAYNLKIPFTDIVVASWGDVQRGDIIVFKYPLDPSIDYVKRVVAVAGDKVQIIDDVLYINGEPQPRVSMENSRELLDDIHDPKDLKLLFKETLTGKEHWLMQNIASARPFTKGDWPLSGPVPYVVPENSVFCIGDNRDNSADSRVWGEVPMENIRGKALFVLWSIHSPSDNWLDKRMRFSRFGHWLD